MTPDRVVEWESMCLKPVSAVSLSTAMMAALLLVGAPSVTAAPATDGQGFVDSTARCAPPDTAVVFGATSTSRVAICKKRDEAYQYRGVRVRDGAKLIIPAEKSGDGTYTANNDGITYAISATSLMVSAGERVIREEPMVDFHGSAAPAAPLSTSAPRPTPLPPPLPAEVGGTGA